MADYCLSLICPPAVEERLLDALLANAGSEVFTSTPTHSHGIARGRLSANEQVLGRSRAVQVDVVLTEAEWSGLKALLQREFAGTGVRYRGVRLAFDGEFT